FDDLSYTCEQLACEGKMVLVAALDGNFLRKPFAEVSQLISFSDEIKKLSAVCMDCGDDAPFTFRCTNEREKFFDIDVISGRIKSLCGIEPRNWNLTGVLPVSFDTIGRSVDVELVRRPAARTSPPEIKYYGIIWGPARQRYTKALEHDFHTSWEA
ncbi:thymidine kinase domain protein, partial [Teladorsagia circumcincta]